MKAEAQRIAIAEACGWTYGPSLSEPGEKLWVTPDGVNCGLVRHMRIPDCLNDLNVAVPLLDLIPCLGWRMQNSYNGENGCWVIISNPPHPTSSACSDVIVVNGETFAKAICQTFLRTIGKWVE